MENNKVKRGEIYYYDFGINGRSIQRGLRPVLIVQCDEGNKASSMTIIAPITTAIKRRYLPSHIYLNEGCGLKKPSMVLLEQLETIDQSDLLEKIGCVTDENIKKLIDNGLKKALGLWVYKKTNPNDIRCLCKRCLEDYKQNRDIVIRRFNPYERIKRTCDKCSKMGYEYLITEKSRSGGSLNGHR